MFSTASSLFDFQCINVSALSCGWNNPDKLTFSCLTPSKLEVFQTIRVRFSEESLGNHFCQINNYFLFEHPCWMPVTHHPVSIAESGLKAEAKKQPLSCFHIHTITVNKDCLNVTGIWFTFWVHIIHPNFLVGSNVWHSAHLACDNLKHTTSK